MVEIKESTVVRTKSELSNISNGVRDFEGNELTELVLFEKIESILSSIDRWLEKSAISSIEQPLELRESAYKLHKIALLILRSNNELSRKDIATLDSKVYKHVLLLPRLTSTISTIEPVVLPLFEVSKIEQVLETEKFAIIQLHKVLSFRHVATRIERILSHQNQAIHFTEDEVKCISKIITLSQQMITFNAKKLLEIFDYNREIFLDYVFNSKNGEYGQSLSAVFECLDSNQIDEMESLLSRFIVSLSKKEEVRLFPLELLKSYIVSPSITNQKYRVIAKVKHEIDCYLRAKQGIFGIYYE